MKQKYVLLLLLIFMNTAATAQNWCGFTPQQTSGSPMDILKNGNAKIAAGDIEVPLSIFVEENTPGVPVISTADLNAAIAEVNLIYRTNSGSDLNFILAELRTPSNPESKGGNTINISIYDGVGCGAAFGGQISINVSCTGRSVAKIMAHEIGHVLGLPHTHGFTNSGTTNELVDGSNCSTAGDRICDTPADPNLLNETGITPPACNYTGSATDANGDTYVPLTDNIMSYVTDGCMDSFTPQQISIAEANALAANYNFCNATLPQVASAALACYDQGAMLMVTNSGSLSGTIRWYEQGAATPFGFGASITTANITSNTVFEVTHEEGGCESDRQAISVSATPTNPPNNLIPERITDLFSNSFIGEIHQFGSRLTFVANGDLYASDGTTSGTNFVGSFSGGQIQIVGQVNTFVFFGENDGSNARLWEYDYLTNSFTNVWTGGEEFPFSGTSSTAAKAGDKLVYTYTTASGDFVIGAYDTSTGTAEDNLRTFSGGGMNSLYPISLGNKVIFGGYDAINGFEPWVTDGTAAGTQLLANTLSGTAGLSTNQSPSFVEKDGFIYFRTGSSSGAVPTTPTGGSNHTQALWKTDGTPSGTSEIFKYDDFSLFYGGDLGVFDGKIILVAFTAIDLLNNKLFTLNASETTVTPLVELNPSGEGYGVDFFETLGNRLIFGTNDVDMYVVNTSGTVEYLRQLEYNPSTFQEVNGELWFQSASSSLPFFPKPPYGGEYWKTDGTQEGTNLVADINSGTGNGATFGGEVVFLNNRYYFLGNETDTDTELWSVEEKEYRVCEGNPITVTINDLGAIQADPINNSVEWFYDLGGTSPIPSAQTSGASYTPSPNLTTSQTVYARINQGGCEGPMGTFDIIVDPLGSGSCLLDQTITFDPITTPTLTYGDFTSFTLSATASSGLPVTFASSDMGVATISGNTVTIVGAGTTDIIASQGGNAIYNAAPDFIQTLIVNKAPLTIKADDKSKDEGDTNPPLTITYTGFVLSETEAVIDDQPITAITTVNASTPVGTYDITISGATFDDNYDITLEKGVFTVNSVAPPTAQTITFDPLAAKTYGDAAFTLGATASSGLPVSYASSNPSVATVSGSTVTIVGAGSVDITASQAGDATYSAAADVPQTLTVNPAPLTITAEDKSREYNAADPTFTFTYAGFVNLETPSVLTMLPTASVTTTTATSPPGLYPNEISPSGATAANYTISYASGDLTITPATPTLSLASIANKLTSDAPFAVTASISPMLTPLTYSILSGPATIAGTTITLDGTVGTVQVQVSFAGNTNYNAVAQTTSFDVVNMLPPPVTPPVAGGGSDRDFQNITFPQIPAKTYGEEDFFLNATASSGLEVSYQSSNPNVIQLLGNGSIAQITGAGFALITARQNGNGDFRAANPVSMLITVNKASLNISADSLSRLYRAENPEFTLTYEGFVNEEDVSVLDRLPNASTTATLASPVGEYPIVLSGGSDDNYEFLFQDGILTVTQPTLTISIDDYSRLYGQENPEFVLNYTGFVGNEDENVLTTLPTVRTTATQASDVGEYSLEIVEGEAQNYQLVYVFGELTVEKAPLWITADDKIRALDEPNPELTFSLTGFVNGDEVMDLEELPTIATSATAESAEGQYPITLSGGKDENYELILQDGTLNIRGTTQTIRFNPLEDQPYTPDTLTLEASTTSGLPLNFEVMEGPATIEGNQVILTGIGEVVISIAQEGDTTFLPTEETFSFTVSQALQQISFNPIADRTMLNAPNIVLNATASSGLPVSFEIEQGSATLQGDTLSFSQAEEITVVASQAGNELYLTAESVSQTFTVRRVAQEININRIRSLSVLSPPFAVQATTNSNLPLIYRIAGPASIDETGQVTLSGGIGEVTVTVAQAGNAIYLPAEESIQFNVRKAPQFIAPLDIDNKTFGDEPFTISTTSTSGLRVSYRILEGPARISGNRITILGAGEVVMQATQRGDAIYAEAFPVTATFTVQRATQTITIDFLDNKMTTDRPFFVSARTNSRLPLTYSVEGPARNSGSRIILDGTKGEVTVTVSQAGNENYFPAEETATFGVFKRTQTITFEPIEDKTFGDEAFELIAEASSDLPVTFSVLEGNVSIEGNLVTILGGGTVRIAANQAGDMEFDPAPEVVQTFEVQKATQTVTIEPIADQVVSENAVTLQAEASSGLPITFVIIEGGGRIEGDQFIPTTAGTVTVRAVQEGNQNYEAAFNAVQFEVFPNELDPDNLPFDILLYPNPASEQVFIELSESPYRIKKWSLYDAKGSFIRSIEAPMYINNRTRIDVENLPDGVYLLNFEIENLTFNRKVVKEN